MQRRYVALYCSAGPYRHVRALIEEAHANWLPWGYRMAAGAAEALGIRAGDEVELWEIDDTRNPHVAAGLTVAEVDYVAVSEGYIALTLRPTARPLLASQGRVLGQAQSRRFVQLLELSQSGDGRPVKVCEGKDRRGRRAQDGAAFQAPLAAVPLGR